VGHFVTGDDVLSGDLANLGHGDAVLEGCKCRNKIRKPIELSVRVIVG